MRITLDCGTYLDLDRVAHAWITDQPDTVHLYFDGGHEALFIGSAVETIWQALTSRAKKVPVTPGSATDDASDSEASVPWPPVEYGGEA